MNIYRGSVIAKQDINDLIKKGDGGILSVYLPKQETFSLYFGDKKWYTFNEKESAFLEKFQIIEDNA